MTPTDRLALLRSRTPAMLEALEQLTSIESPSADTAATEGCAKATADLIHAKLGVAPQLIERDGRTHLLLEVGQPRVLLLGHIDTVWPLGTIERWPFSVAADQATATGPGSFDMKGGVVQGLFALETLDSIDGVALLLTTDEEIGSPSSRTLIEGAAGGLAAVLVLEPSHNAALKTSRKGVSTYTVRMEGRAAHAGLDPASGINATVEAAHQVLAIEQLARPGVGTTVTPTTLSSGTTMNVVPASAALSVDVRAESFNEQLRVDEALRRLRPRVPGARLTLEGGPNRPPLPADSSAALFARAQAITVDGLGLPPLEGVAVGGGSDGNFTAAIGTPTLDGLGPVGGGAHAEGEHVVVSAMAERAALVAELVAHLLAPEKVGASGR